MQTSYLESSKLYDYDSNMTSAQVVETSATTKSSRLGVNHLGRTDIINIIGALFETLGNVKSEYLDCQVKFEGKMAIFMLWILRVQIALRSDR